MNQLKLLVAISLGCIFASSSYTAEPPSQELGLGSLLCTAAGLGVRASGRVATPIARFTWNYVVPNVVPCIDTVTSPKAFTLFGVLYLGIPIIRNMTATVKPGSQVATKSSLMKSLGILLAVSAGGNGLRWGINYFFDLRGQIVKAREEIARNHAAQMAALKQMDEKARKNQAALMAAHATTHNHIKKLDSRVTSGFESLDMRLDEEFTVADVRHRETLTHHRETRNVITSTAQQAAAATAAVQVTVDTHSETLKRLDTRSLSAEKNLDLLVKRTAPASPVVKAATVPLTPSRPGYAAAFPPTPPSRGLTHVTSSPCLQCTP